ncbi:DUF2931 family protein [Pseudomonas sp. LS44]|uniref:DUF2931 family protein n=1 Tax=Pseudomonas sp. LS44 TaxID=1357074 RepID=UPI00215AD05B|nr:DUF2931 family protein [Pseudomonas sp. LS44]UVE17933.1 DUF2931 family protein [Pseudomonas sp. LS44]
MKRPLLVSLTLLLAACATGQERPKLPYDAWEVGVFAPSYMEAWIESVDVIDQRGLVFEHVHGGVASITNPANSKGNPAGWPKNPGGSTKSVGGVDLPEIIFVRWQSLAEPQTYNVRINISKEMRNAMVSRGPVACPWKGDWGKEVTTGYRKFISIGLAPGGIAKVWLQGSCMESIEVGRFEAAISKVGPYDGTSGGKHRPLSKEAKGYIDKYGIPYGSW